MYNTYYSLTMKQKKLKKKKRNVINLNNQLIST